MASRTIRLAAATLTTVAALSVASGQADATRCFRGGGAAVLDAAFSNRVDRLNGADYQRAIELPDGRTLWTLQDAFVTRPRRADRLVHNVAVVQQGGCFSLVRTGTTADPQAWIGAPTTDPLHHWYWPLGGIVAADGTIKVFVAEMVEHGPRYLSNAEPVATWLATIDPASLQMVALEPAPNPGPSLDGWSVASDDQFTVPVRALLPPVRLRLPRPRSVHHRDHRRPAPTERSLVAVDLLGRRGLVVRSQPPSSTSPRRPPPTAHRGPSTRCRSSTSVAAGSQ